MRLLKLIVPPAHTGHRDHNDPKNCPIAKALRDKGFIGVHVYGDKWSALKCGFIPVGGKISEKTQLRHQEIANFFQSDYIVLEIEITHFYRGD